MKKCFCLITVLCIIVGLISPLAPAAQAATFSDVSASHWAFRYIDELSSKHIIDGMGNGKYEPDGTLTRAQYLKLLVCIPGLTSGLSGADVSDVAVTNWAYPYVTEGLYRGVVSYSELTNKCFRPDEVMDRKTAALWMMRLLGALSDTAKTSFTDFTYAGDETSKAIATAQSMELLAGYPDGGFHPDGTLTRAEAAAIVKRTLDKYSELNAPLDETEQAVYQDGVKQLTGDTKNILQSADETSGTYVFDSIDETMRGLKVGDCFVVQPCEKLPSGLAAKVKTISISGDSATIVRDTAEATELFKSLVIQRDEPVSGDDIFYEKMEKGVTLLSNGGNVTLQGVSGSTEVPNSFNMAVDITLDKTGAPVSVGSDTDESASIHLTGTASVCFTPRIAVDISAQRVFADVRLNTKTKSNVKLSGKLSADAKVPLAAYGFKVGGFTEATVGVYLDVSASGELSVSVERTDNGTIGLCYDNGTWLKYRSSEQDSKYSAEASLEFKFGPKAEIELNLFDKFLSMDAYLMGGAKADLTAVPLNLEARGLVTPENATADGDVQKISDSELKYHACSHCIKGSLEAFGECSATFGLVFGKISSSAGFEIDSPSIDFHISADVGFGLGKCPNYKTVQIEEGADDVKKTWYDKYQPVLSQYLDLVRHNYYRNNPNMPDYSDNQQINLNFVYDGLNDTSFVAYYSLIDIDNNGVPELLIGGESNDAKTVYAAFGYTNEVVNLLPDYSFGYKESLVLCKNGFLRTTWETGAYDYGTSFYKFAADGSALNLHESISVHGDYGNGSIRYYHDTDGKSQITKSAYEAVLNSYTPLQYADYHWVKLA